MNKTPENSSSIYRIPEEKAKMLLHKCDTCKLSECIGCEITYTDIKAINEYIEQLKKEPWQELCEECSEATKEAGFTKEDTDKIIKETREAQRKAQAYDCLVEKLKEDIVIKEESDELVNICMREVKRQIEKYRDCILDMLEGGVNEGDKI